MNTFKLVSDFKPAGDQPKAINEIVTRLRNSGKHTVLLGVTGSGKTFTMANVIAELNRPVLIITHNKTLCAQLYAEFKSFFPHNAVEYFISYYDYYQPEAYIPQTDTYIEKDSAINEQIDRLRLKASSALLERKDVIVVASVSCIYNIGSSEDYSSLCLVVERGKSKTRKAILNELISIQYNRTNSDLLHGTFRARGDTIEIHPPYTSNGIRIHLFGDEVENIVEFNPVTNETLEAKDKALIYPARHFVTPQPRLEQALTNIELELNERLAVLKAENKVIEHERLKMRTKFDIEMIRETGTCHGIENYSRHLSGRPPGARPLCLLDYFPKEYLFFVDESHVTIPQIRGMHEGDKSRKKTLVDYGFRLPSALDNRPLRFDEFESIIPQAVYFSATPAKYELNKTGGVFVEQIIRPTGLVDPQIIVRSTENQVNDLLSELPAIIMKNYRTLVTTLTKRMSEDLTDYFITKGIKARYLHSEIDALERIAILMELREGKFDVLIGVNLLREGLDLPEVGLVAVFDADKEGFLRSETSLIQVCGRAARNVDGKIFLYADKMTGSIERAIKEMARRRKIQEEYNVENKITPKSIVKAVKELEEFSYHTKEQGLMLMREAKVAGMGMGSNDLDAIVLELKSQLNDAVDNLDFELASIIRDKLIELNALPVRRMKSMIKRSVKQ
ncbi:MAG: excinuclease ABC subunit UvrB [Elusimicrobiota bacterium]